MCRNERIGNRRDSNSLKAASAPHESHHGIILWKKAGISSAFSHPKAVSFSMFSNYSQALRFMQSTAHLGSVPGLARLQALLSRLGHPERQSRYIHVAGTNGKGSVSAMTASILQAAGYRVGLFTSPFLRDVREQIQCNGEMMSPSSYMHLASRIAALGLPAESLPRNLS
ncbi:MAG: hypothetical protein ACLUVV_04430 [Christensenellales bacterium]